MKKLKKKENIIFPPKIFWGVLIIITILLTHTIIQKIFFIKKINNLSIKNKRELKYAKDSKKHQIKVIGNRLFDSENKKIILIGASTQFFGYHIYSENLFWERYEKLVKNKVNLITIFININNLQSKMRYIDKIVEKTHKDKVYLIITPTLSAEEDELIKKFLELIPNNIENLMKRYKDKSHIMYGIWAEPRDISWNTYIDLIRKVYSKRQKKDTILVVSGIDWGARFHSLDDLVNFGNIILNYHYYPARNEEELKEAFKYLKEVGLPWDRAWKKFPVIIGEFGGVWGNDFSSKLDLEFIRYICDQAIKKELSLSFYTIDPEGKLSIFNDETTNFSEKGKILIDLTKRVFY